VTQGVILQFPRTLQPKTQPTLALLGSSTPTTTPVRKTLEELKREAAIWKLNQIKKNERLKNQEHDKRICEKITNIKDAASTGNIRSADNEHLPHHERHIHGYDPLMNCLKHAH
jgi:hypothetical protein